ncbi:MAG: D-2-hydroxyacid dehydrogenase [Planctomycetota bacterium]|jgi:glycerate dehydrogenase
MPDIVVLDGYCLNPGDLSWEGLEALGKLDLYDRTPVDQVVERARGAGLVLTNKTPITEEAMKRLPEMKYIGLLATGYNVVDVDAASSRGIVVTNVPTYGTESVAQMVFAHLLHFTQGVARHSLLVREGRWSDSPDWCYWDTPLVELSGLTLGIIGLGRIGRAVARIGLSLGMKVLASDQVVPSTLPEGIEMADADRIFRASDVVTLHCPLTPETERIVNEESLARMKESALLINTSRGPLVDEKALARALNSGQIAGAGLDVLSQEPPAPDNPLLQAKHCIITPHNSWTTRAARMRLMDCVIDNCKAFLAGTPKNVVNP